MFGLRTSWQSRPKAGRAGAMIMSAVLLASFFAVVPARPVLAAATWTAYIDMNAAGNTNNNAANVLEITPAAGTNPPIPINPATSFILLDQASGTDTDARLQVDTSGINTTSANGTSSTGGDANDVFGGIVDGAGVYTFADTGDVFTLNFSGLDPAKLYTVVLTANRDQTGTRVLDLDLLDVDGSTPAPSDGTTMSSPTHARFNADDNTTAGDVARWVGINPGADGDFSVQANRVTSVGSSSFAPAAVMLAEEDGTPIAPTGVTAVAGNTEADIAWTAPAYDGDSAITDYQVTPYIGATAGTPVLVGSAATSKTITGLTNGTAYTFKVAAINTNGTGPDSAASNEVTPHAPLDNWTAYADLRTSSNSNNNAANVLEIPEDTIDAYGTGTPINPATSFTLTDLATGFDTDARLQVDNSGLGISSDNGATSTGGPAFDVFGGIVDGAGVFSFDNPSAVFQINLTGLDPAKRYTVALTSNRDQTASGDERWTDLELVDADSATEASGGTTTVVSPTHVRFGSWDNTTRGDLAQWTGIDPGADGDFSVATTLYLAGDSDRSYVPVQLMLAEEPITHTLAYDANGGTGSQTDPSSPYADGATVTVLDAGTMANTGFTFAGWNTLANGSGTAYVADDTFTISADTTLYAQWTPITHTVTYDANGGTGSQTDPSSPYADGATVTVLDAGTMANTGFTFAGWNTLANGSGTAYVADDTFTISADTTLYAQWTPATHTVSGHLTPGDAGGVVWAFKASDGSYAGGVLVAGDGSYSLDLVPDSYKLWITDVTGYPDQAYGPDGTFANATVVDLTTTDQPGTDITLAAAPATHTVSGHLTPGDAGGVVWAFKASDGSYAGGVLVAGDGSYSLDLVPDSYKLWITDVTGYPDQAYGPDGTFANATVVDLTTTDQPGTDITLAAAPATHTVSGHLTPGDAGGVVWAFKASDGSYAGGVLVAGDGSYSLDLVPDSYKLWITDVTGYPDQAYGPDGTFANATVVDLTTTDQPGTDITLAAAPATHTVSGHLTPGDAGGVVWAFKASDGSYAGGVLVAGDGSYSLDLVPDSYKLWITDVTGYPDQAYGPDGTFANATVVDLTTTDQPGTDITLAAAPAFDYYVDNTNGSCSDAGSGDEATPFCTIGHAASMVTAGETVRVVAGTYAETVQGTHSGAAGNPITYSAAPGVTVTGNGTSTSTGCAFRLTGSSMHSYIVIDGFTVTDTLAYGICATDSDHVTISNNDVRSAGAPGSSSTVRMGIYLSNTDDSLITGNTTHDNSQDGIRLTGGSSGNTVSNNVSYGNAEGYQRNATGIQVTGADSDNNTIIDNITYDNEDSGIQAYAGAQSNAFIDNLSYGNGDHGIDNNTASGNTIVGNTVQGNVTAGINLEGSSGNATLANNIAIDNGLRMQVGGGTASGQPTNIRVDATSVSGTNLDYDLIYETDGTSQTIQWNGTSYTSLAAFQTAVPGQETHGIEADPLFVSPAAIAQRPAGAPYNVAVNVGDYHLSAGSPAIDSANSDAPSQPSTDLEGQPRFDDPATTNTGAGSRTYDDRGAYEYQ